MKQKVAQSSIFSLSANINEGQIIFTQTCEKVVVMFKNICMMLGNLKNFKSKD